MRAEVTMRFALAVSGLSLPAVLLVAACTGSSPEPERTVEFAPYAVPCETTDDVCLVDLSTRDRFPFHDVHGYAFAWGYRQKAILRPHRKEDPKVDTTSWKWDADTLEARRAQPDWSFRTRIPPDSTRWLLAGVTLAIRAYPSPILVGKSADRDVLLRNRGQAAILLRISPANGGLAGDSAQALFLPD
jgi:hypothetical protein